MTLGISLYSILAGTALSIWALVLGYSFPVAILAYPIGGSLGAFLFMLVGMDHGPARTASAPKAETPLI